MLGAVAVAAVGTPLGFGALASGATVGKAPAVKAPTLLWSPVPAVVGLNAFEGIEADRVGKFPQRKYVYVEGGDHYRFNIWANDRDTTGGGDRQRTESKGMVQNDGTALKMLNGQTWTISYELFMPTTLHGTSRFTHIFQTKTPNPDAGPWVTLSLTRNGSKEVLQAQADSTSGLPVIAATALAPLRNKWITIEWTLTIGTSGSAKITIRNGTGSGAPVVATGTKSHLSIPDLGDYVRPKWGIYRSVQSGSADIIDTYLLTRNYKAYRVN
jgi:hypothetical protein